MRTTQLAALTVSLGLLALGAVAIGPDAMETSKTPGVERPDLIVVCAYGRILPTRVLERPPRGAYNLHFS